MKTGDLKSNIWQFGAFSLILHLLAMFLELGDLSPQEDERGEKVYRPIEIVEIQEVERIKARQQIVRSDRGGGRKGRR